MFSSGDENAVPPFLSCRTEVQG